MSAQEFRLHAAAAAKVLAEMSAEIERLGAALCTDPSFALNHVEELQAIDLIAQKQRSLASLLEADCPKTAVNGIGLDALAGRLQSLAKPAPEGEGRV